jgi:hypothetical protein
VVDEVVDEVLEVVDVEVEVVDEVEEVVLEVVLEVVDVEVEVVDEVVEVLVLVVEDVVELPPKTELMSEYTLYNDPDHVIPLNTLMDCLMRSSFCSRRSSVLCNVSDCSCSSCILSVSS